MTRKVYHVTKKDDHWQGKRTGADRASVTASTKAEAVAKTKGLAKAAPLGQIRIHKENGQIQMEHTYGQDPRKYLG